MPRDIVSLECEVCGNRNYTTTKNKKVQKGKITLRKYCRYCKKHTIHKEVK